MLFLIFKKGDKQKIVPVILKFVSMLFLIFEKGDKEKIVPGILKFTSMFSQYLKRRWAKTLYQVFWDS